ncbi:MAG: hypothetical protein EXS31_08845 [Pedosphaera sp.]|nr:hypothetical protein [Pedosphaera sp.]
MQNFSAPVPPLWCGGFPELASGPVTREASWTAEKELHRSDGTDAEWRKGTIDFSLRLSRLCGVKDFPNSPAAR